MDTSQLIARLLAGLYLTVAAGFLVSRGHYTKLMQSFRDSPALLYLSGVMAFLFGFFIVSWHNVWEPHWSVTITIFGWLALTKGILLLIVPDRFFGWFGDPEKWMSWAWIPAAALGLYFGWFGFFCCS